MEPLEIVQEVEDAWSRVAFTTYAVIKMLHVLLASLWVGAVTYDWVFVTRPLAKRGGVAALGEFAAHATRSTPFFAIVTIGTVLTGYETARRLLGTANPLAWSDAGDSGGIILAGLVLALIAMVLGILQMPPSVKRIIAAADDVAARSMFRRINLLAFLDLAALALLVVLMVGTNTGVFN